MNYTSHHAQQPIISGRGSFVPQRHRKHINNTENLHAGALSALCFVNLIRQRRKARLYDFALQNLGRICYRCDIYFLVWSELMLFRVIFTENVQKLYLS